MPHKEPTAVRRTFAHNLRLAREAAGVSRHALAAAASCAPVLLANIETNATNVKLDTITRLAKALGLAEIDLLQPSAGLITAKQVSREPVEPLSKTTPTAFRRQFALNLRERREAAKLIQTALAKAAGMPLSSEGEIEVNAINVTLDTVTRLARALGITELDLLGPKDR